MSRKELGFCLVLLALGGCKQKAPPLPSSPVLDRAALVRGAIPQGEESELLRSRCEVCHSLDYVLQQRLSGLRSILSL